MCSLNCVDLRAVICLVSLAGIEHGDWSNYRFFLSDTMGVTDMRTSLSQVDLTIASEGPSEAGLNG